MWRDPGYLLDVLIAARRAQSFVAGIDQDRLRNDKLTQHAVIYTMERIGGAIRRLSAPFKASHTETDWARLDEFGASLLSDYRNVDLAKVWDVVQNDIPKLIAQIEPLVPPDEDEGGG
jgi:uncharacterized protein with HEPN domain